MQQLVSVQWNDRDQSMGLKLQSINSPGNLAQGAIDISMDSDSASSQAFKHYHAVVVSMLFPSDFCNCVNWLGIW